MAHTHTDTTIKPSDLRGILEYVPQFRDHIFIIALDGSIIEHENFANVLTDIAVLKSLNIHVVIVHGIGQQLKTLSSARKIKITDAYGEGPTDEKTLSLVSEISGKVSHQIIAGLTQNNIKCALTNAIRSAPVGIIKGKDQGLTGKVEKMDLPFLKKLIDDDIIPIINPLVYSREGQAYRANSDLLASELAVGLKASKLIYLTSQSGLTIDNEMVINIPLEDLAKLVQKNIKSIDERIQSKALYAAKTLNAGTPRAHILDGRVFGGLLTEIFDKVGLGTMIHANEYQQIRPAKKKDLHTIFSIIKNASKTQTLRHRTKQSIEKDIAYFYVYEIDDSIIACMSLIPMGKSKSVELSSVLVQSFYHGKGVGKKMVQFAALNAKKMGFKKLIALSTQTESFFKKACHFTEGALKDLPLERRNAYKDNGRNSKILIKLL